MIVLIRVAAGVLLLAHGLVHLLYLARDVPEFSIQESWLVPEAARRPVALALIAATIAAFTVLALAVWGVPGLSTVWPFLAIIASALSLVLLIGFWDTRVVLGVIIDLALITLAVTHPAWTQEIAA
jgi:hypothetical protein